MIKRERERIEREFKHKREKDLKIIMKKLDNEYEERLTNVRGIELDYLGTKIEIKIKLMNLSKRIMI